MTPADLTEDQGGDVPETARVALVGVGNNASALVQGVEYYRTRFGHGDSPELPGIRRPVIDGLRVGDVEFVAAFRRSSVGGGVAGAEGLLKSPPGSAV